MSASSRVFPLLLALALAAPMANALASPLYAVTALDGAGSDASGADSSGAVDLDSLIDPVGSWDIEDANAIIDSDQIGATACRTSGECDAVRLDPQSPVPGSEPGAVALLCFGLALVVLRGQRPPDIQFRAL